MQAHLYIEENEIDRSKIVLTDSDKKRQKKNIDYMKDHGLPYLEDMPCVPIDGLTELSTPEQAYNQAIVFYTLAQMASFIYYLIRSERLFNPIHILNLLNRHFEVDIRSLMSEPELKLLNQMMNGNFSQEDLLITTYLYEESAMLLWALGLIEKPDEHEKTKRDTCYNAFEKGKTDLKLRSKDEILEYSDFITRLNWAYEHSDSEDTKRAIPLLTFRSFALDWLLCWDTNNLLKDELEATYVSGNWGFSFTYETKLLIDDFNPYDNEELFIIKEDNANYSELTCLGDCSKEDFEDKVNSDIERKAQMRLYVYSNDDIESSNLKGTIKRVIVSEGETGTVTYYMLVDGKLLIVEAPLYNTDYHCYEKVIEDLDNSYISRLVQSIKPIQNGIGQLINKKYL